MTATRAQALRSRLTLERWGHEDASPSFDERLADERLVQKLRAADPTTTQELPAICVQEVPA